MTRHGIARLPSLETYLQLQPCFPQKRNQLSVPLSDAGFVSKVTFFNWYFVVYFTARKKILKKRRKKRRKQEEGGRKKENISKV